MPQLLSEAKILGENEKILMYGRPGVGKTHIAGTMPGPVYYLVVGGKNELKTLKGNAFKRMHGEDRIFTFDNVLERLGERGKFEDASAFDIACDMLDDALELDAKGDFPFESLVIENVTTLMEVQMNKAIYINYSTATPTAKTAMSKLRKYDIIKPGDNDYGSAQSLMAQFVSWLSKIDKHICLVGHSREQITMSRETRLETLHSIVPEFVGRQRTQIPRDFDNVWYVTMHGQDRGRYTNVQTVGDAVITAKTRVGEVLPILVRNMDMAESIAELAEVEE